MNALLAVAVLALLTGQLILISAAPGVDSKPDEPDPDPVSPLPDLNAVESQPKTLKDLCKETFYLVDDILAPFSAFKTHINKIKVDMKKIIKSVNVASSNADGHLTPINIIDLCYDVRTAVNEVYFNFSSVLSLSMHPLLESIEDKMSTAIDNTLERIQIDGFDVKEWPASLRKVHTKHLVQLENSLNAVKQHFIQDSSKRKSKDLILLTMNVYTITKKIASRFNSILWELKHHPKLLDEKGVDTIVKIVAKLREISDAAETEDVSDVEKLKLLDDAIGMITDIRRITNELIDVHIPKIDPATAAKGSEFSKLKPKRRD